jgi:hypothetical protein
MRRARPPALPHGQSWKTFLANHTDWACDFLQVHDTWFRSLFAFFVIDIKSREVIHVGVTRAPTEQWTAQQLRNITPFGEGPDAIIRARDNKFGTEFDRTKASINEFQFRSRRRSSAEVPPSVPFQFSRRPIMTTRLRRESADLRSSHDKPSRYGRARRRSTDVESRVLRDRLNVQGPRA